MRLQRYINETIKVNGVDFQERDIDAFVDFWVKIEKNCKEYLKIISRNNARKRLLLRGTNSTGQRFFVRSPRKDRYPRDTSSEWHNAFDSYFKKNFGWRARTEGLFCTGGLSVASSYGATTYIIFPVGRFKYIWSDTIHDLYSKVSDGDGWQYLEKSEYLIDIWREEYDDQYSPGSGNGEWIYNGDGYGPYLDENAAVDTIFKDISSDMEEEKDNLESILDSGDEDDIQSEGGEKKIRDEIKNIEYEMEQLRKDIRRHMEWQPSESFNEFTENAKNRIEDYDIPQKAYDDAAEDICGRQYTDKDLIKGLNDTSKPEIMIKCDEYYAISYSYLQLVLNAIWREGVDPKQLSFNFNK